MREIKFRAWDKETHEMCNVLSLDFDQYYITVMPYHQPDPTIDWTVGERHSFKDSEEDRFVLMQFTGLKDKNGKDIYEGDIIKTEYGATGIVVYSIDQARFAFDITEPMWEHPIHLMDGQKEVIGNIHEQEPKGTQEPV